MGQPEFLPRHRSVKRYKFNADRLSDRAIAIDHSPQFYVKNLPPASPPRQRFWLPLLMKLGNRQKNDDLSARQTADAWRQKLRLTASNFKEPVTSFCKSHRPALAQLRLIPLKRLCHGLALTEPGVAYRKTRSG
jgi:hypothetical protein